mgnify:CR=1 FL=1
MKSRKMVDPAIIESLKAPTRRTTTAVLTYEAAVLLFLDYCALKGLAGDTRGYYAKELKQFRRALVNTEGDISDIRALMPENFEKAVRWMIDKPFARTTINSRIKAVKTFFAYCKRKKYVTYDPTTELETLKNRKEVGATFTRNQLQRLADAPDLTSFSGLRDLAIMTTFEHTGMRVSELCGLTVEGVRFEERSLIVQKTKNGYARRIPMTNRLHSVLSAYVHVRGDVVGTDALFLTQYDSPMPVRSVQYQLRVHGESSGVLLETQVSPHVYRRTFAKMKIQAGVNIFVLRDLMGHADIKELENYVKIYSPDLDDAIEKGIE